MNLTTALRSFLDSGLDPEAAADAVLADEALTREHVKSNTPGAHHRRC